jgi:hypothetical protein
MPTFPRGAMITLVGATTVTLSDHNRTDLEISPERIENKRRMVDGTMRKNVVATKRRYSCNWTALPSVDARTVDGYAGAVSIKNFYENNVGAVTMTIRYDKDGAQTVDTDSVMISSFSYTVTSRAPGWDLVDVSIEFEEV